MARELVRRADAELAEERNLVLVARDVKRRAVTGEADWAVAARPHRLPRGDVVIKDAECAIEEQIPLTVAVVIRPAELRTDEVVLNINLVNQLVAVVEREI